MSEVIFVCHNNMVHEVREYSYSDVSYHGSPDYHYCFRLPGETFDIPEEEAHSTVGKALEALSDSFRKEIESLELKIKEIKNGEIKRFLE